jgi:hypothetical protein
MKEWFSKLNENHLAVVFVVVSILLICALVWYLPAIGIAPLESLGERLLRLALYTFYWPLILIFMGGRNYNIIKAARERADYSLIWICAAVTLGAALVIGK